MLKKLLLIVLSVVMLGGAYWLLPQRDPAIQPAVSESPATPVLPVKNPITSASPGDPGVAPTMKTPAPAEKSSPANTPAIAAPEQRLAAQVSTTQEELAELTLELDMNLDNEIARQQVQQQYAEATLRYNAEVLQLVKMRRANEQQQTEQ